LEPKKISQRILVTGGAGFIGSHLVKRLASQGHQVHVLHRPKSDLSRLRDLGSSVQLWECDLLDDRRLDGVLESTRPQIMYHFAGDASLRHLDPALAGVKESIDRNVRSSINLFVAAQGHSSDLALLVRLGGLEEYGRGPVPYVESQREQPVSPYSASQVAVTHYLQMLAPELNYRALTIRPALIYGPAQSSSFFIPALIEHCLRGRDFSISSPEQGRDLLYIDDLIDALVLLLETPLRTGEIVNIGAGREYLMADVATTIIRHIGAKISLTKDMTSRAGQVEHLYCSGDKARELLSWQPLVDLNEGLKRTIQWFRERIPFHEIHTCSS
jgi:nucleoside-diphosphate-sugar epimerase